SLRWYADFFGNARWMNAIFNSAVAAVMTTVLATTLGTLAALGISRPDFPARRLIMALLISPMIVPIVIVAVGSYLFFGQF
uniref:ABC transporter permease n=1 Tax=Enterobacter hormaechei TaxID=158836 RepID=UPI0034D58C1B